MRVMTTVTMPNTDWMRVIAAVGTVHAYHVRKGEAKEADEMELVGRQIARSCRHQARTRKEGGQGDKCATS